MISVQNSIPNTTPTKGTNLNLIKRTFLTQAKWGSTPAARPGSGSFPPPGAILGVHRPAEAVVSPPSSDRVVRPPVLRPPAGARPAPGAVGRRRLVVPPRPLVTAVAVIAVAAGARPAAGVRARVAPVLALVAPAGPGSGPSAPPRPAVAARGRAARAAGVASGAAGRRAAAGARRQAAGAARARGGRRGFLLRRAGPHVVHVLRHGGRGHGSLLKTEIGPQTQRRLGTTEKGKSLSSRWGAQCPVRVRDTPGRTGPRPSGPTHLKRMKSSRGRERPSGHLSLRPANEAGEVPDSSDRRAQEPPLPKSRRGLSLVATSASKILEAGAEHAHRHPCERAGPTLVQSPSDVGCALETRMRVSCHSTNGRASSPSPTPARLLHPGILRICLLQGFCLFVCGVLGCFWILSFFETGASCVPLSRLELAAIPMSLLLS